MRPRFEITESQKDEIHHALGQSSCTDEYRRLQCVWLRALGMNNEKIAKATTLSESSVHIFQSRFFRGGLTALLKKPRGGRFHQYLSIEEEGDLLHEFLEKAEAGQILVIAEVKTAYERAVGRAVARSTIYRVLERHGWRKIMPRPRHPKSDPQVQEDFKKNFRI